MFLICVCVYTQTVTRTGKKKDCAGFLEAELHCELSVSQPRVLHPEAST